MQKISQNSSVKVNTQKVQKLFLRNCLSVLKAEGKGVAALGDIIGVKEAATYTRLSGKKELSFSELNSLCYYFGVTNPFSYSNQQSEVSINFPSLNCPVNSEKDYLLRLNAYLQWATKHHAKLSYITSELPIFNYFKYYELGLFKMFIYGRTIWNTEKGQEVFSENLYERNFFESMFQEMYRLYANLDSQEIWNVSVITHTLNQLKYYSQAGVIISKTTALKICNQLAFLIKDLEKAAERGYYSTSDSRQAGDFKLFYNEILHTNNTIIVTGENAKVVFNTYDNPNFFQIRDERFWEYSCRMFESLKKRCIPLHKNAERSRLSTFKKLFTEIDKTVLFINQRFPD